ncbi:hypothetical protein J7E70_08480 [Variovorax paradoxus]|nr:hypothetical protein [Variovorax paradoxus]MBT2300497.1 hypothetical protein [Variovorax paradoxus]
MSVLVPVRGVGPEAAGHRTQLDRGDSLVVLQENAHVSPFLFAVPLRFDRQSCNRFGIGSFEYLGKLHALRVVAAVRCDRSLHSVAFYCFNKCLN